VVDKVSGLGICKKCKYLYNRLMYLDKEISIGDEIYTKTICTKYYKPIYSCRETILHCKKFKKIKLNIFKCIFFILFYFKFKNFKHLKKYIRDIL